MKSCKHDISVHGKVQIYDQDGFFHWSQMSFQISALENPTA